MFLSLYIHFSPCKHRCKAKNIVWDFQYCPPAMKIGEYYTTRDRNHASLQNNRAILTFFTRNYLTSRWLLMIIKARIGQCCCEYWPQAIAFGQYSQHCPLSSLDCINIFPFEVVYNLTALVFISADLFLHPFAFLPLKAESWFRISPPVQNLVSDLFVSSTVAMFLTSQRKHCAFVCKSLRKSNTTHHVSGTHCLDVKKLAINHANSVLCLTTIITPFRLVDAIAVQCWSGWMKWRSADYSSLLRPSLLTEFLLSLFRSGRLLYFRRNRVKSRDTKS